MIYLSSERQHEIWQETERKFACSHEATEVVFFVKSNGSVNFQRECLRCGERKQVPKADLTSFEWQEAQPRDEERKRAREWWKRKSAYRDHQVEVEQAGLRQQQRFEYDQYMRSSKWYQIRDQVLKRCNSICEGCGKNTATQVHHLTYARFGNEMLFDLVGVCKSCHERIHREGD